MENKNVIIENEIVYIPGEVSMSIAEIADLFGVFYKTAKREIRFIEKSSVVVGDYSMCCTVEELKVYPEYYGLEMIIALSFRIQSKNAQVIRNWIMKRVSKTEIPEMLIIPIQNAVLN